MKLQYANCAGCQRLDICIEGGIKSGWKIELIQDLCDTHTHQNTHTSFVAPDVNASIEGAAGLLPN